MRFNGLSETLVCTVQRFVFYEAFVHNARHVSKHTKCEGTTLLMPLNAHQSDGVPVNPF